MTPTDLPVLRSRIETRIAANRAAIKKADKVDAFILEGLNRQLGRFARALRNPQNVPEYFGPNWHGPAIEGLIKSSEDVCAQSQRIKVQVEREDLGVTRFARRSAGLRPEPPVARRLGLTAAAANAGGGR